MVRICVEAEKSTQTTLDTHWLDRTFSRIDQFGGHGGTLYRTSP